MKIRVTKSTGVIEDFDRNKLHASLTRAGADRGQADEIIGQVLREASPLMSTKNLYRSAKKYLKRLNRTSGMRYSLKQALFQLGPSGYPFEKYIGELLKSHGYQTEVGIILKGKCVDHEVDVLAVGKDRVFAIECKYHSRSGLASDVKTALYVHSRFEDLRPTIQSKYPDKAYSGQLITNTRCTDDAVQFAECSGLEIKSWKYPQRRSLEKMIEEKRLYPVTIVSGIQKDLARRLIEKNIILLKDLVRMRVPEIQETLHLTAGKATALKKQAEALCRC